jgi:hypothetical protein
MAAFFVRTALDDTFLTRFGHRLPSSEAHATQRL